MKVKIVTDSTADLPSNVCDELGIDVVPLNVHFGEQVLKDGQDVSAEEFYHRLVSSPSLPTTSQPSVGAFAEVYSQLLEGCDSIISIHISSKLSGTCNSAIQARKELEADDRIHVIDALTSSLGLGLVAKRAAELANQSAEVGTIVETVCAAAARTEVFGLLETLEYLQKGGRIGKAQAFVGSLLNIKPILTVRDGVVHPLERARTRAKGIERLKSIVADRAPLDDLAVMFSTTEEEAYGLAKNIAPYLDQGSVTIGQFGPVLGTHLGPGALGVALIRSKIG